MAHTLDLVYGSTTISLGNYLLDYSPSSLSLEEVLGNPDAVITEQIEVGPLPTATIQAVQAAFAQAWLRKKKRIGDKVYLQLTPQGGSLQRTEITPGSLVKHNENVLGYEWIASAVTGFLTLTRRPWWERARAELQLDNGSAGGPATGGVTVYNHDDGGAGHDNWVSIAAAQVTGAIPAPVELQITNTHNVSPRAYNLHVAHNVLSDPANLTHILEAENASTVYGGGSTTVSAASSNGNYVAHTWASSAETVMFQWTLSTALLNACAGNRFRVLARFATDAPSGLKARLKVLFEVTTLWEGPQYLMNAGVGSFFQDLGVVRLPPALVGTGNQYPLYLNLYYEKSGGGTANLDFLALVPLDGYRKLEPRGYGIGYNVRLVDDMIENYLYTDGWATSGKTPHYVGFGDPIMLWPGRDQRLYFYADKSSGGTDIDQTFSVRAYLRPRLLTI